jgi:hypothetical protein
LSVAAETGTSPIDDFVLGFVMIQPVVVASAAAAAERV